MNSIDKKLTKHPDDLLIMPRF